MMTGSLPGVGSPPPSTAEASDGKSANAKTRAANEPPRVETRAIALCGILSSPNEREPVASSSTISSHGRKGLAEEFPERALLRQF
jgi:hypothetical protein